MTVYYSGLTLLNLLTGTEVCGMRQWTTEESDGFRITMESRSNARHLSDFGDEVSEKQSESETAGRHLGTVKT